MFTYSHRPTPQRLLRQSHPSIRSDQHTLRSWPASHISHIGLRQETKERGRRKRKNGIPHPHIHKMPRFSSRSSSVSAYDDDIDAITPCPSPTPTTEKSPSKSPASLSSSSSSSSAYSSSRNHPQEELRQSSRRSSSSSHRRILAAVFGRSSSNSRSVSPTSSSSLDNANSEEDLDMFASRRRDSVRALEQGAGGDPERLWRRMLELQQAYGCYNSARMSAALESGDASLRREFSPYPCPRYGFHVFVIFHFHAAIPGFAKDTHDERVVRACASMRACVR